MFVFINKLKIIKKQYVFAFIFLLLLVYDRSNTAQANTIDKTIPSLSIEEITPKVKLIKYSTTGIIDTINNLFLIPEVTGKVEKVYVKKGDFVKKDQVISSIDVQEKEKRVEKAEAMLTQRQLEYQAAKSLNKTGYNSDVVLASSFSALTAATLDLDRAKIDLDNCHIKAPFDGVINNINVKEGMVINRATDIVNIIQCENYIAKVNIPESIINKLTSNKAEITLSEFNHPLKGYLDGVSMGTTNHSYAIEIKIPEIDGKCMNIIGMTADVKIILGNIKSYHIPPYALSLSDQGVIGIKILNDEKIVEFHPIEILEEDEKGYFWVKGLLLDNKINLIGNGHAYVQAGQKI